MQADVFAYAMFLYEIMALHRPFEKYMGPRANFAIQQGDRPKWCPEVWRLSSIFSSLPYLPGLVENILQIEGEGKKEYVRC